MGNGASQNAPAKSKHAESPKEHRAPSLDKKHSSKKSKTVEQSHGSIPNHTALQTTGVMGVQAPADPTPTHHVLKGMFMTNSLGLKRLPIPTMEDTVTRYLASVRHLAANPEEFEAHEKLVRDFAAGEGMQLHNLVEGMDKHEGYPYHYIEKLWDDMYNGPRDTAPVNYSPFFGITDAKDDGAMNQAGRAAGFVHSFVKWTRKVLAGELEPDAKGKLCSSAFVKMFSSAKVPRKGMDFLVQYPEATNVIVLAKGRVFSIEVVDAEGAVLDRAGIAKQMQRCLSYQPLADNVTVLTSEDRDVWAGLRAKLELDPVNLDLLAKIDAGIIAVCLDDHPMPTLLHKSKALLLGPGHNRWWDKQQLVVAADGRMGITFEHSYSDGTGWGRFIKEVMSDMEGKESGFKPLTMNTHSKMEPPTLLHFNITNDVLAGIATAQANYSMLQQNVDQHVLSFKHFGKNVIKTWGTSPDAACQMAFQIAFFQVHGKQAPTYEACATRSFFHGRTETIRSASKEALDLCKAYESDAPEALKEKFKAACTRHSAISKEAASAQGVDRHLYALHKMAEKSTPGKLPKLFSDPLFVKSKTWLLSTSNGSADFLDLFGFAAVSAEGYGVGYLIGGDDIAFNVACFHDCTSTSSALFADALQSVLLKLRSVHAGGATADPAPAVAATPAPKPEAAPAPAPPRIPKTNMLSPGGKSDKCMVVVLNCGSSSLKYALFEVVGHNQAECLVSGLVEKIGLASGIVTFKDEKSDSKKKVEMAIPNHKAGLDKVMELLMDPADGPVKNPADIKCVGHRVVHGGEKFTAAAVVNEHVKEAINTAASLAPLHNPANMIGIEVGESLFSCPQVAVFDTAFHMTMDPSAYLYAIPYEMYQKHHIRRYGFHGTSYLYVSEATSRALSKPLDQTSLIVCHLGNGSSMCAIRNGKCVDTTMGMTPLEGLVMGTRSGDIDPAVHKHLHKTLGMSPDDVDTLLNKKSGLHGLCGDSDMRAIQERSEKGDELARNALGVFVHRVRKYVGAFMVALGGQLDALVFTAGIGENSATVRQLVCSGLEGMGLVLDEEKNKSARGLTYVQSQRSKLKIMVVPTNEELSITLQSASLTGIMPEKLTMNKIESTASITPDSPFRETMRQAKSMGIRGSMNNLADLDSAECRCIYINSISAKGTLLATVSLSYQLLFRTANLGFFRAFSNENAPDGADFIASTMKSIFEMPGDVKKMTAMTKKEALSMLATGQEDEMVDLVVNAFEEYKKGKDFVVVGCSYLEEGDVNHRINTKLASALGIPMVLMYTCTDRSTPVSIFQDVVISKRELTEGDNVVDLSGVIVNRVPMDKYAQMAPEVRELLNGVVHCVGVVPLDPQLTCCSLELLVRSIHARVLSGKDELANVQFQKAHVASGGLTETLQHLKNNARSLLIVDASRMEIFLSLLVAIQSTALQPVAGIVLNNMVGSLEPIIVETIAGLPVVGINSVPIIITELNAFELLGKVDATVRKITTTSVHNIEAAQRLAEIHLDSEWIQRVASNTTKTQMTPKKFQYSIASQARANLMHIVLPEGNDKRVVQAAGILVRRGLCKVTLLGNVDEVRQLAAQCQADISGCNVVDPTSSQELPALANALFEARKSKGMTEDKAKDLAQDANYYGTLLMFMNKADGMVSGACHTTADTMRPALQIIKTAPGFSLVSSVFFMLLPKQVYVYGDCAINVDPDSTQLGNIAASSALTALAFGIEPRVAMLSYATGESNKGDLITKVREATAGARALVPNDIPIEGPMQFDAAVDPEVAKVKVKEASKVAGKATVCVFPDLNTGNNTYKAVQQASGCIAMGPIMQGLKKPVNDLSRGCTVDDIVNTVVITCVQAIQAIK